MKLIVNRRSVYGRDLFYPVNEAAKIVARMVGQTTLDERTLGLCKQLGFEIELEQDKLEF